MIKTITVTNYLGNSLTLELTRPEKSGFVVKSIDGLDPPAASINASDFATGDGAKYNSSRISTRNVVLHLTFMKTQNETIEDIRHKAYKYFPPKTEVKLTIDTDIFTVETRGRVESTLVSIFSNEEGADVSILCPDPYLYSTKTNETLFTGVIPLFTFPFSNESPTSPMLEFGKTKIDTVKNVHYEGDFEIGIVIKIHAVGDVSNIAIYNLDKNEEMSINTDIITNMFKTENGEVTINGIVAEDEITIDTRRGQKSAILLRNGIKYNILNSINKGSTWFTLSKGGNTFAYRTASGEENIEFHISNQVAYLGV